MNKIALLFFAAISWQLSCFSQNVGINVPNPQFPLSFPAVLGDKISLYGDAGPHYGFGIQPYQMQIHTDGSASDITFGYGSSSSFTELMRLKGNGNLGIGTYSPGAKLHVHNGNVYFSYASDGAMYVDVSKKVFKFGSFVNYASTTSYGINSVSLGSSTLSAGFNSIATGAFTQATGSQSFAMGGETIASGRQSFAIGYLTRAAGDNSFSSGYAASAGGYSATSLGRYSAANGDNSIAIGAYAIAKAYGSCSVGTANDDTDSPSPSVESPQDRIFQIGNGSGAGSVTRSNAMTVLRNGNTGVGTTNPLYTLHVAGNLFAIGLFTSSDIRYKQDLSPISNSLSSVLSLQGLYYFWKKGFTGISSGSTRQIGFSAQEVEKVFPEIVVTGADGYKAIDYSRLTPVLVEAIKEQQKEIEELKDEVKELRRLVEKLINK